MMLFSDKASNYCHQYTCSDERNGKQGEKKKRNMNTCIQRMYALTFGDARKLRRNVSEVQPFAQAICPENVMCIHRSNVYAGIIPL